MIRDEKFVMSRKQFAINLGTVTAVQEQQSHDRWSLSGNCEAVWYRRKDGITRACVGTLSLWSHWRMRGPVLDLTDPVEVLSAPLDGRYGGECLGRWDGRRYWGAQEPFQMALHLSILEPMITYFPSLPPGYDGWWTFQGGRS